MPPGGNTDSDALTKTASLIKYLADLTSSATRAPVHDITANHAQAPRQILWTGDFPRDIKFDPEAEEVLLRVEPASATAPPVLPDELVDHVDPHTLESPDVEPELHEVRRNDQQPDEVSDDQVVARFENWIVRWRQWAREEFRRREHRDFHERLERAAREIEQRDDEFECVLATGLVRWRTPDGRTLHRHLLVEQVVPRLGASGVVTVTRTGNRRLEDRELFEGQQEYRPDRGQELKKQLSESDSPLLAETTAQQLREWLSLALNRPVKDQGERTSGTGAPESPELSDSPALLLRPRNQVLVSEAYQHIARELTRPDAEVPVGLAQLVVNTEREQRDQWLSDQGAVSGDVLGDDPLFPKPANAEQSRVIELLRGETGVVVQGPPGTGKTHTIANLVSALLARGQRVLVTSQKDQALRVLRDKIPDDLRNLCVLLTGGSKDAAVEVEQGLDALAQAINTTDQTSLTAESDRLSRERDDLREQNAKLNDQVRELRAVELTHHEPVAPGYSREHYRGTLARIVREVLDDEPEHQWMPDLPQQARDHPPLSADDLAELARLLAARDSARMRRAQQEIPDPAELPASGALAGLVEAERSAQHVAAESAGPIAHQLAQLSSEQLERLQEQNGPAGDLVARCGLASDSAAPDEQWRGRAAADRLAGRRRSLWQSLLDVRTEPERLRQLVKPDPDGFEITMPVVSNENLGEVRGWWQDGHALLEHLGNGGKLRSYFPSRAQKEAQKFRSSVQVNGRQPRNARELRAALDRVEVAVATAQLAARWAEVAVTITPAPVNVMLSELTDNAAALDSIEELGQLHESVLTRLREAGILLDLSTPDSLVDALRAVPAAKQQVDLERARNQVRELQELVRQQAEQPDACPELSGLLTAIGDRDACAYAERISEIETARAEQADEIRCASLLRTLWNAHSTLARRWEDTAHDPVWQHRDVRAAWAWRYVQRFLQHRRNAAEERERIEEFERNEERLRAVTERLVAVEATRQCHARMSDEHSRALNTYRAHVSKIGAGQGKKVKEFRRAARTAMDKARDAVPAWVVPLPNLLDNLSPDRDRFDVVIVDEASQVGIEHLYLLWMAPRVIVVGDEKQCTPGSNSLGQLNTVFERNKEHLADLDADISSIFTPKSHLYEVLSARSGKDALVRLREHFRCVPEIIAWSSQQFYEDGSGASGLIPLRERTGDDLTPIRVTQVEGAYIEGRESRRRNKVEAREIVDTLVRCLEDPAYAGKSFGIVVLQSVAGHIRHLENLINESISPEQRQERGIRVGTAPNFQGDERDVILLSLFVAHTPNRATAESFQQVYNVAASRAKDQMWLFTSVGLDQLKPNDLRSSLQGYMLDPPPVFGHSPELDEVSPERATQPFDSIFEQRVYREIKRHGYHVVPQYPVGSRKLDLVVVGEGGRIAVECDGDYFHASAAQQDNDAYRDRELARMGWTTLRIRESEFEVDYERELAPVWAQLARKNIRPGEYDQHRGAWQPVDLDAADSQENEEQQ